MKTSGTLKSARSILIHLILLAATLLALIPFIWLIEAAFTTGSPSRHFTLDNFQIIFNRLPLGRWLVNSIFVSCTYTVLVVTLSSLGGFALAKYRFAGKKLVLLTFLGSMLLPSQVLLPGSYELMCRIGWVDSYLALIVPGTFSVLGIFLFRQAMLGVPDELIHSARIDGAGELRIWWQICLPVVRPMLAAYTLLSFLTAWNSFLWPQIILQDESKYTAPIGLANLSGLMEYQTHYGLLMAATLLSILPVMILFFVLQKDFISGLTSGAVKG